MIEFKVDTGWELNNRDFNIDEHDQIPKWTPRGKFTCVDFDVEPL